MEDNTNSIETDARNDNPAIMKTSNRMTTCNYFLRKREGFIE